MYLDSNQISTIDYDAFYALNSLTTLYLRDNCLVKLNSNLFQNLLILNIFDLERNLIRKIVDNNIFKNLKILPILNLANNLIKKTRSEFI